MDWFLFDGSLRHERVKAIVVIDGSADCFMIYLCDVNRFLTRISYVIIL